MLLCRGTPANVSAADTARPGHQAEADLGKSWQLDPGNARVASDMIVVAMGLESPRDDMEVWLRRAMRADADCETACAAKLSYLEPKWHGSEEAVLLSDRTYVLTRRPARVKGVVDVDLPRPRTHETVGDPKFAELKRRVLDLVWEERTE